MTKKYPNIYGHGGSSLWKELKDFLHERLGLEWDEFNRESPAAKLQRRNLKKC